MRAFPGPTSPDDRRADRRGLSLTLPLSALAHFALLAFLAGVDPPPARVGAPAWIFSDPIEAAGGRGGQTAVVQLDWGRLGVPTQRTTSSRPSMEIEAPAIVLPDPVDAPDVSVTAETPQLERPPAIAPPATGAAGLPAPEPLPGLGGGSGGGAGPGSGPGTGSGAGPGIGSGIGGDGIRPPTPLSILIPPTATEAVRGGRATVRLQVDPAGTVRSVDVVESSGDRGYDQQLRRVALGWRFRPARDAADRPVAYPFEVSFTF